MARVCELVLAGGFVCRDAVGDVVRWLRRVLELSHEVVYERLLGGVRGASRAWRVGVVGRQVYGQAAGELWDVVWPLRVGVFCCDDYRGHGVRHLCYVTEGVGSGVGAAVLVNDGDVVGKHAVVVEWGCHSNDDVVVVYGVDDSKWEC